MNTRIANYELNKTIFRVTYGDITQLKTEAIVSSDDNYLSMGGGVSMAISEAGGKAIREEARKYVPLKIGDVAVTSAGNLPAKYIFHAVTIDYTNMIYPYEDSIKAATLKCMQLADTLGVKSIAFPALGTGVGRFPFQLAADMMTRAIADYLMGDTHIELVTISLFPREGVKESDLNLFYESSVALASVSTQSKKLDALLSELECMIRRMNMPQLSSRFVELQTELQRSQVVLRQMPQSLEHLEQIQEQSRIVDISKRVVALSSEVQNSTGWTERQHEAQPLQTRLGGLYTLLNIQVSNLNRSQIEKAKYGGQLVPPIYENSIGDAEKEIAKLQEQIIDVKKQLEALHST